MAAWDESMPSPDGLAGGRSLYDADALGTGAHGELRPLPLRWWEALTPRSWHAGPRIWADRDSPTERAAFPELVGEAEDDSGARWSVTWRDGPGLSDSFCVRREAFVASCSPTADERERAALNNYADFRGEDRAPSGLPQGLMGRGTPSCVSFANGAQRSWEALQLPRWAVLPTSVPTGVVRLDLLEAEQDIDASQRAELHAGGMTTHEVRAYGWPLRAILVTGWRRDLEWYSDAGLDEGETNEWSSDGLGSLQPLRTAVGPQLALPATGLPWKPLWLPFLANSLILGVPLTLAGVGVSSTVRWGIARIRGKGDKCPRCGYARKGLAPGAACPECGEARVG